MDNIHINNHNESIIPMKYHSMNPKTINITIHIGSGNLGKLINEIARKIIQNNDNI